MNFLGKKTLVGVLILILGGCGGTNDSQAPPEIISINPTEGPIGTSVTVKGTGFSPVVDENAVSFGGMKTKPEIATESRLSVAVPEGAESGPITVSVHGQKSTGPAFTVKAAAPGIQSVEPDSGLVGAEVTINGLNFSSTSAENSVTFNETVAEIVSAEEKQLVARVPEGASDGPIAVNVNGQEAQGPSFDVITIGRLTVAVSSASIQAPGNLKVSIDGGPGTDTVVIDGNPGTDTVAYEDLAFSDLEQGTHNVELQGLGDACFTSGENPKEVSVSAGDTTHVEFKIGCEEKPLLTGKLVFSSDSTGNSELFMMNPDGSGMEQITQTSMGEIEPAISPGGSRIAYVKGSQIFVMDADGSNDIQLTDTYKNGGNGLHDSYHISWSPDGNKLLFISNRDDNEEIYIMNKDGSNPVNLTRNAAEDYISTDAWSPDGTRIVFWSNRSQNGIFDIYTMNPDGSDVRKLTNSKYNDMGAAWSPAGGRMVFSSDRDWNAELYLMNTDGSNIKRMTDHPDPDVSPVWSPDGNKIAFLSMIEGDQYKYDIFILDLSTGSIKDLTPDGYYKYNERDVDWSPIK